MSEQTVRVDIRKDEWWPVHTPEPEDDGDYEIPVELWKRWRRVNREMDEVLAELRNIYDSKD